MNDPFTYFTPLRMSGRFPPRIQEEKWIYIVSSALASLPSPGNRVGPADSGAMFKLSRSDTLSPLIFAPGAHHYRFVGAEITTSYAVRSATVNRLISLGLDGSLNPVTSLDGLPTDVTLDRCFIHGTSTGNIRCGVLMDCVRFAAIDSYLSDIHEVGADNQALLSFNSPGPFKIVNNYLEAACENVMFGGANVYIPNVVGSDVEMRRNHFFKPLSWKTDDPSYAGVHWSVKNLLEFKSAQRVLAEGNVLEHNWVDGQVGFANLLTVRNSALTSPGNTWAVVQDMTLRRNIYRHAASGISVTGTNDIVGFASQQTKRVHIRDNLLDDIGAAQWGGGSRLFQLTGPAGLVGTDTLVIEHNTGFQTSYIIFADGAPHTNFRCRNNIYPHNDYGVFGSGFSTGNPTLAQYFPGGVYDYNAMIGLDHSSIYPANNFFPANIAAVGFVDYAGGDYRLSGGSPYRNAGSDGADLGADINALNAETLHSIGGQWGSEPPTYSTAAGLVAEIPRQFLDTTYRPQSGARVNVNSLASFQAALDSCALGDTIVVDVTANYTEGTLTCPAK